MMGPVSAIRLLPDTAYRLFSDGQQLLWEVGFANARMWKSTTFDAGTEFPLDEEHLQATAMLTGLWVSSDAGPPFLVGQAGCPVTVREMMRDVELYMQQRNPGDSHSRMTAFVRKHGGCKRDTIGYFGFHVRREPFSDTCLKLHLACF